MHFSVSIANCKWQIAISKTFPALIEELILLQNIERKIHEKMVRAQATIAD